MTLVWYDTDQGCTAEEGFFLGDAIYEHVPPDRLQTITSSYQHTADYNLHRKAAQLQNTMQWEAPVLIFEPWRITPTDVGGVVGRYFRRIVHVYPAIQHSSFTILNHRDMPLTPPPGWMRLACASTAARAFGVLHEGTLTVIMR